MPYYDVANLVTLTKMNMIGQNALWLSAVQQSQLLLKSPADLCRCLKSSKIGLSYKSNLIAS
jgi:hypothetical protein